MTKIQHFILTRFNLRIWNQDKNGQSVRTDAWLEQRFDIFEKYCLPSVKNQRCKDFEWIILFDSETPARYKDRIKAFAKDCPQLTPIYVKPEYGSCFRQIFREVVVSRLKGDRVITTYLDNDDALNVDFVGDLQGRVKDIEDNTFVCYPDGLQYFTGIKLLLQVHYPANHFISVVEPASADAIKTVYGYGSHAYIGKIPGVKIEFVNDSLQWCEVVHDRNMVNDAFFIRGAKMVTDGKVLKEKFSIDQVSESGFSLYVFKFIPRYIKTFFRRAKGFVFGRKW